MKMNIAKKAKGRGDEVGMAISKVTAL